MITTDLGEIIYSFSRALDLSANGVAYHHQSVALICSAIAEYMEMSDIEKETMFLSALVHDAGVSSRQELELLLYDEDEKPQSHCQRGYQIFSASRYLREIGEILLYHHDRWQGGNCSGLKGNDIPVISSVLYLADRVAVKVETGTGYILNRYKKIIQEITDKSGSFFSPRVVEAFLQAAEKESFWLSLQSDRISELVFSQRPQKKIRMTPQELYDIAYCLAQVIDNKSPYTHYHSTNVARVAECLGKIIGFSENEQIMLRVAGYLHDLGKIAVPNEILDKPSPLTEEEFAVIKQHPYHTYQLLRNIPGFEPVSVWGGSHHERLNGTGYPFKINEREIPLAAKIIAVSDVLAALAEDRPYRKGMSRENCLDVLNELRVSNGLDSDIVRLAQDNFDVLYSLVRR